MNVGRAIIVLDGVTVRLRRDRCSVVKLYVEGVYGCFMTCNVFLAGNSEVSLELQCFTAELITYIVCECDAPECISTSLSVNVRQNACAPDAVPRSRYNLSRLFLKTFFYHNIV